MDKEKLRQVAEKAELLYSVDDAIEKEETEKEMVLGRRLFYLRKFSGKMSRRELSEKTGVSQSVITSFENGRKTSQENLIRIADLFDTDPEYFLKVDTLTETERRFASDLNYHFLCCSLNMRPWWANEWKIHSAAAEAATEAIRLAPDDRVIMHYISSRLGTDLSGKDVTKRNILLLMQTTTGQVLCGHGLGVDACMDIVNSVLFGCRAVTRAQYLDIFRTLSPLISSYHEWLKY